MNNRVYYHSRHSPIEHLRLDQPMGKNVYDNLLTHSLDEPYVDKLCDYGIDIVETRLVWHELEPEPGVYDFSRFERDVEKIKSKGLGGRLTIGPESSDLVYMDRSSGMSVNLRSGSVSSR